MRNIFVPIYLAVILSSCIILCAAEESNASATNESGILNVLGNPLQVCSKSPMTGYYRDGYCSTGSEDTGTHVVCASLTDKFLAYTKSQGNDLSTPQGGFPGLRAGDRWCLCIFRWNQANADLSAPNVVLEATNAAALKYDTVEQLSNPK